MPASSRSPARAPWQGGTAQQWLHHELAGRLGAAPPPGAHPAWRGLVGLDRDRLAALHALLVRGGATGPAAAKWLAGWLAGGVAAAVGRSLALRAAAVVVDPRRVRWRLHPGGWPDGTDLGGPRVVVASGHAWAGQPAVSVVAEHQQVREAALGSVVAVAQPLVDRLRTLAKVGRPSLWAEVGDRMGLAVTYDPAVVVDERVAEELRAVVRQPMAPWRATPDLVVGPTAAGPAYLGRKGGCCLAFQCAGADEPPPEPGSWGSVFRERFPDRREYCSTCPLLDAQERRARQRLWVEHHRGAVPTGEHSP